MVRLKPDATSGFETSPLPEQAPRANSFADANQSSGAGLSARSRAADADAGSVGWRSCGSTGFPFSIVPRSAGIETESYGSVPVAISYARTPIVKTSDRRSAAWPVSSSGAM